ncbi:MAG: exo 1,3/1,4-beta-D-glucan glucohydrolase [Pseudomonadota bacterium]
MEHIVKGSALAALCSVTLACQADDHDIWPRVDSAVKEDPAVEARISEILDGMTLEQKVGQMMQAEIQNVSPGDATKYHLGSILNGGGSFPGRNKNSSIEDWVALADRFYDASVKDGGVPIIWGTDAVHGHNNVVGATLFPHNIGLGAMNNPELMEQIGAATAREVRATGIDWIFAPTVAVVRDDRWGRSYEGYSEDPEVVKAYAGRMVTGMQGSVDNDTLFGAGRTVATAKHFIGDGGTDQGVDQGDTRVDEQTLFDVHAQGYVTALQAGVQTVMATFNRWNGNKVHGEKYLLTDVLKDKMGFDGFVVGDWNGHGQVPGCTNSSCAQAINAGVDLVMVPENWRALHGNTVKQVKSGEISMARIDDAVRRILRVKARSGLLDAPRPSERSDAGDASVIGSPEHRTIARQAVRESLVLLKNAGNVLPLSPKANILVAGKAADSIGQQSGGWTLTWQGTDNKNSDFPGATSILGGIQAAVESAGGTVTYAADGDPGDATPDVAIVVFGETPYAEGQGDIKSLDFGAKYPEGQKMLDTLRAAGIPTVSVFLTGRPLWVNPELNRSDAFVVAWLPGSEGQGVSDVLFTDADGNVRYDFTGRLTFSWPSAPTQTPLNKGDANKTPLFAYGAGLGVKDKDTLSAELTEARDAPATDAAGGMLRIFRKRPQAPFKVFLGDKAGWNVAAEGAFTESWGGALSVRTVDKDVQEDARQFTWSGKGGDGQAYMLASAPQDLRPYLESDSALLVRIRVDKRPKKNVKMRMGCVYPCFAEANMTPFFKKAPLDEWTVLSVDLKCFADNGADFSRIDVPFLLMTHGKFQVSTADIAILPGAAKEAAVSCSR